MANLDPDENIPTWLPLCLPDDILEEIYVGIMAVNESATKGTQADSDPADGYIIQDWFGPFLLSSPNRFPGGRC